MKIINSIRTRIQPERWPFFYGWFILAVGAFGVLMSLPGQTVGVSVFIDPLMKVLGTGRSTLSFTYMIGTLGAALFLPVMGKLFEKKGAPFIAVLSGICLGSVLLYMAGIDLAAALLNRLLSFLGNPYGALLALCGGFFFLRLWGQGVLTMVSRNMIMKWFDRRRGFANGLLGIITTVGFALSPRFFDRLIVGFSWRGAYIVLALIVGVLFPLAAFLFYRDNPRNYGLVPDGTLGGFPEGPSKPSEVRPLLAFTLKEAKDTSFFWYVIGTLFLASLVDTAFTFHIVSIFEKAGLGREAAVRFFFPAYVVGLGSHFLGSWLSDHIESKYFSLVHLSGVLVTCVAMLVLSPGIPVAALIVGQGICHGMYGISSTVLWPRYFGT